MKKGIIMEMDDQFLTMLTPEGEFVRAHNMTNRYQIGQEIEFRPYEHKKNKLAFLRNKKVLAAMIACIFIMISLVVPYYENNKVYAYMSIDLNPSIELAVNKKFQVLSMHSYNKEGENIVKQIDDWKRKDVYAVMGEIMGEIKKQGYTKMNDEMLIATVFANPEEDDRNPFQQNELHAITKAVQDDELNLTFIEATEEERVVAAEQGVTIGKFKEKETNDKKQKESNLEQKPEQKAEPPVKIEENPQRTERESKQHQTNQEKENGKIPYGQLKKEENANENGENNGNGKGQQEKERNSNKNNSKANDREYENNKEKNRDHPSEQKKNNKPNENNGNNGNKGNKNKEHPSEKKHLNKNKED